MINIGDPTICNNELLVMSDLPSSHWLHPLSISLTRESKGALMTPAVSTLVESFVHGCLDKPQVWLRVGKSIAELLTRRIYVPHKR